MKISVPVDTQPSQTSLKQKLRKILPPQLRQKLGYLWGSALGWQKRSLFIPSLISNYSYDYKRYVKWSSANSKVVRKAQLQAVITMDYHRIEKGLALKEPRVGFGSTVVQRLVVNLNKYWEKFGWDKTAQFALNTLFSYYKFNLEHGQDVKQLHQKLMQLKAKIAEQVVITDKGGTVEVSKQSILTAIQEDFNKFCNFRYSIRQFTSDEVGMDLIEKAVTIAQKTPSVCNRQSSKVYVLSSDEDKRRALSYQNGNRGFGDQASKVLVVVSDLEHFTSIGERNQGWIDGGMFAMSLVYALHSLGLGTCCLNWSVEHHVDRALKRAMNIKHSELVIMMIAVGHLPEQLRVAQSPRKPLEEVLIVK